jgi:cephalosporin-C deacetylase-like acetyl esterase
MNTRRRFLQAGSLAVAGHLSELSLPGKETPGSAQGASEIAITRDYWNDFPNYLISVVNEARHRRKSDLSKLKTEKDAAERASFIRSKVWQLIGSPLEKAPLNVTSAGVIERGSYRIEKLIFESQPQFYVPAHLYVPKSGKGPFPGVISPLGHTPNGKNYRSYQTVFQNLARKGFVVLTWDPPGQGERLQYPAPGTNRSRFGPTGEHDQFGWPAFLVGSTTTQFETWDAIRALDYLLSRSEVDSKRIGCCGHSGGGTATMYLCALEPRIHAAIVVEGHTENVAGANYEPPGAFADAEQNIIGSLPLGIDRGDLLAAFAPKPLLICFTHMDVGATYSPHYEQGTREIFRESKDQYALHHAAEKVKLFASNLPHDYDFFHRRATYDWFNKWLGNGASDNSEAEFENAPESALNCTSTGQVLTSLGGRTAYQLNSDRLRSIEASRGSGEVQLDEVRHTLRRLLGLPSQKSAMRKTMLSKNTRRDLVIEEFEFYSEPTIRVPGWFLKPAAGGPKFGVVVMLLSSGKNRLFDDLDLLAEVTQRNLALCAIDTRASGQAMPRLPSAGPLFYGRAVEMAYSLVSLTAGTSLVGHRVWDFLRCLDYLGDRPDVDDSRIGVYGTGPSGLEALFGAALDDRIRSVLLDRTLTDFGSLVAAEDYNLKVASFVFGLLQHFDLPDICSTMAPRPLWLLNPVDPKGDGIALSELTERYAKAAKAYAILQRTEHFSLHVEPEQSNNVFDKWVKATLS